MKKALPIVIIFLLLFSILFSGCEDTVKEDQNDDYFEDDFDEDDGIDDGGEDNGSSVPDYTELSITDLPSEVRLDVPTRRNVAGFCYLESYSMMLAFFDNGIDTPEVFASAGMGAPVFCDPYSKSLHLMESYTVDAHVTSMNNFNISWVVGYAQGGNHGTYLNGAVGKLIYSSDEALSYLKAVLHSGQPVQVHLDLYYLEGYNQKFQDASVGSSHFMVVTGYDDTNIYFSDTHLGDAPNDQFTDMAVPVETFLSAWEHGGDIGEGFELQTGPYWMLFFTSTVISDLNSPSFTDIVSLQKSLSEQIEENIDTYISKIETGEYDTADTKWGYIANMKQLFAEYLREHGYDEAADAYDTLYNDYQSCQNNQDEIIDILNIIKTNEINARNLLI